MIFSCYFRPLPPVGGGLCLLCSIIHLLIQNNRIMVTKTLSNEFMQDITNEEAWKEL
jgi:hypothetical protein